MPAISELSSTQLNTINSGGYAGEVRISVCPSEVVFQCEVAADVTNSVFLSFAWTNTLQGDHEDVQPDMTVYITFTDDPLELRNPLWQGRAPRVPTADTFYVNESSFNLLTGYVVTVLNTYEPLQMDRSGALVDGYISYANLPPAVKNILCFYYGEDETEYQFSFAPVGQAMAQGATIASYHWTFPAGTTYQVGNASTQNITVTVPYGHIWAFLDIEDSNGVTQRFKFEILVCGRDDPAFMFEAHGDVQINGDIETGWNASVTYFAGVEALLNRTRIAIIAFDNYKSGAGVFPNVAFIGYFVQEDTAITADMVSSVLAETRFEVQSFASLIAQLPVPPLAIRNTASPDAWDELNQPTTQRVIWHLITRYSTFGTLCPIDFVTTDSTWFGGSMDLEASTLLESINRIADEINAKLVFFPGGDAVLEINANFLSEADRNALPALIASGNVTDDNLWNYGLPIPYYQTVGQVECGFATFYTAGADPLKLAGIAPAVARQEGIESPVILAQLLPANQDQATAIELAKRRIGDMLEWLNPPVLINFALTDGWRFVTPSLRVWWLFDLPGNNSTRGLPVPATQQYLLLSISLTWHNDGTWDITGSARLETQGGLSQINVTISPNTIDTDLPVLPIQSDYDAYSPDGTLNYQSTDPGDDMQPFGSGYGVWQFDPMTTEDAGNAADNMPDPNCQIIRPSLNFSSGASRQTSRVTVNNDPYSITVKGSTQLAPETWTLIIDLTALTLPAWLSITRGTHVPGTGMVEATSGGFTGVNFDLTFPGGVAVHQVVYDADLTIPVSGTATGFFAFRQAMPFEVVSDVLTAGSYNGIRTYNVAGMGITTLTAIVQSAGAAASGGTVIWRTLTLKGTGTPPDDATGGAALFGDPFYQYQADDDSTAELYPEGYGLTIQSLPPDVIPEFNPEHIYQLAAEGDGNPFVFIFFQADYSQIASNQLYIRVCGANMGS